MSERRRRPLRRLHRPDPRADVRAEFAFHLEERIEALMAQGVSEEAAREAALRQFGDIERATAEIIQIDARHARVRLWREWWTSIWQDVAYALRAMRRSPGFTVTVVAVIALGIGANTTVFTLLNALLLQPLDAVKPNELVRVYTSQAHAARGDMDRLGASSYADHLDLRQSRALADLAAYLPVSGSVDIDGVDTRVEGRAVSNNFFSLLGRPFFIGSWNPGSPAGARDVVVSHRFWTSTLGADPSVVGRRLLLNGQHPVVIAAVTSARFRGIEPSDIDIYLTFEAARALTTRPGLTTDRGERSVRLIGRLARDATPASAERSLDGIMRVLAQEHPATNARRTVTVRAATSIVPMELFGRAVVPVATLVFAATLVMLAICGVNVAAVLLARTIRRRAELAVRASLGANRLRIVRQLVTENVALALAAGIVVIGLLSLLPVLASALGIPASATPAVDARVLGYAVAMATGFGVVFGLAPALAGMRGDVLSTLRDDGTGARPARARVQRALVCTQIALSVLLLMISAVLLASLARQQRVDPGFDVDRVIVAIFEAPMGADRAGDRVFTDLAVERLGALPGVTSVSIGSMAPFTSDGMRSTTYIPGYTPQPDEDMEIRLVTTGAHYFRTLGIPVLRGRERTDADADTMPRVVVNQSMARRYWGSRDPIGTFVRLGGPRGSPAEVIGVVTDARFLSLAEPPQPMYAVQYRTGGGGSVLVRTRGDPDALLVAVRGTMSRNDVPATLVRLHTMRDILRASLSIPRAVSQTLLVLGLLAIALAAVGLYGVVSYVTAGRTREFGVRLALGATPASITRLVLGYGLRLALIGGALGVVLGLGALRAIESMLYGSWAYAPFGVLVAIVLCAVTLVACAFPALRTTAVSPSTALRAQ